VDVEQHRPPLRRSRSFGYESTDFAVLQFNLFNIPDSPDRGATGGRGYLPDESGFQGIGCKVCNVSIVDGDVLRIRKGRISGWIADDARCDMQSNTIACYGQEWQSTGKNRFASVAERQNQFVEL